MRPRLGRRRGAGWIGGRNEPAGNGRLTSGVESGAEWGVPATVQRSRAFARASSHSRRVRFFKRAIPIGAVLGVAAIFAATWLNPFRAVEGLTLGPVGISGTQVTMESPRLTGFRNDSRPYEVT